MHIRGKNQAGNRTETNVNKKQLFTKYGGHIGFLKNIFSYILLVYILSNMNTKFGRNYLIHLVEIMIRNWKKTEIFCKMAAILNNARAKYSANFKDIFA